MQKYIFSAYGIFFYCNDKKYEYSGTTATETSQRLIASSSFSATTSPADNRTTPRK